MTQQISLHDTLTQLKLHSLGGVIAFALFSLDLIAGATRRGRGGRGWQRRVLVVLGTDQPRQAVVDRLCRFSNVL